jgi:hypothetical protein
MYDGRSGLSEIVCDVLTARRWSEHGSVVTQGLNSFVPCPDTFPLSPSPCALVLE